MTLENISDRPILSSRLEKGMRLAAQWHQGQVRKQSDLPYVQHLFAVALILDRLGYPEDVVIAGLLHDAIEDTEANASLIRETFGETVAELVQGTSETKLDAEGRKRPWEDRKSDHLEALTTASPELKAIVLADKLHNLESMRLDLEAGNGDFWERFNAPKERIFWYYDRMIELLGHGDDRLERLGRECRRLLDAIRD